MGIWYAHKKQMVVFTMRKVVPYGTVLLIAFFWFSSPQKVWPVTEYDVTEWPFGGYLNLNIGTGMRKKTLIIILMICVPLKSEVFGKESKMCLDSFTHERRECTEFVKVIQ